jgi:hypothetical protein
MHARGEPLQRSLRVGWLVVLALVLVTPLLHAFILTNSPTGATAGHALRIGSAAIGIRAVVGLCQRRASRAWVAYAVLYPALILITGGLAVILAR